MAGTTAGRLPAVHTTAYRRHQQPAVHTTRLVSRNEGSNRSSPLHCKRSNPPSTCMNQDALSFSRSPKVVKCLNCRHASQRHGSRVLEANAVGNEGDCVLFDCGVLRQRAPPRVNNRKHSCHSVSHAKFCNSRSHLDNCAHTFIYIWTVSTNNVNNSCFFSPTKGLNRVLCPQGMMRRKADLKGRKKKGL